MPRHVANQLAARSDRRTALTPPVPSITVDRLTMIPPKDPTVHPSAVFDLKGSRRSVDLSRKYPEDYELIARHHAFDGSSDDIPDAQRSKRQHAMREGADA